MKKRKVLFALGMSMFMVTQSLTLTTYANTTDETGTESESDSEDVDVVLSYKTHFDIGFINTVENVVKDMRTNFIDGALKAIDETKYLDKRDQYKIVLPGWPLTKMLEDWPGQTEERVKKIGEAIKNGNISVHALPFSLESESLDLEDMVRSMNYSSEIARTYGIELPKSGKMTDVPSQSWILPTLLKHAGIDFLHIGCNPASMPPDVPPLFWWEGPDGSRVLTMYSKDYGGGATPSAGWSYDMWLGLNCGNESSGVTPYSNMKTEIDKLKKEGKSYKIGSMDDFVEVFLKKNTKDIPVVRGDMPDTWIHGIMAAPTETKITRNMRPRVYQLDSLNTMLNTMGLSDLNVDNAVKSAYGDALRYGEHTWGYNEHVEDYGETFKQKLANGDSTYKLLQGSWDEKTSLAYNMQSSINPLLNQQLQKLSDSVDTDEKHIVVYNSLPWERDGKVEVAYTGKAPASLINTETKEKVAVDSVKDGVLSFTAKNIPSMGYSTYVFSNEKADANKVKVNKSSNVVENQYFKLTFDPVNGSLSSVYDKVNQREWIDKTSKYGFSQYLNERFSNDEVLAYNKAYNTQHGGWAYDDMSKTGLNTPQYKNVPHKDTVAKNLAISYEENGNSVTAVMKGSAINDLYSGLELRVTLYGDQNYIDIDYAVDNKVVDPWPMADWLTFPFAIQNPEYRLYRLGGVLDPKKDIVKDTQVNNMALDGGMMIYGSDGKGIALCSNDAPLVSIGKPGIWKFDKGANAFQPEKPTVFLNLFNNQWDTNYPTWNGGDWSASVRLWSISSADYEKSLVTPSKEVRSPLLGAYSEVKDGTAITTKEGVALSKKGIEVTAFGPNIDGDGTILRLWEQSGKDQSVTVTLPKELKATKVVPVDLRGQKIGKAIKVTNNQFTVNIGKNAPYSVQLDYEIAPTEVDDVINAKAESMNDEGDVKVTWDNPDGFDYEQVLIEYKNADNKGGSVKVDANKKEAIITGLDMQRQYQFTLKGVNSAGTTSKGVSVSCMTSGEYVLKVEKAEAANAFNSSYDPINLVNGNGMTGGNPKTATHNNDRTAYSMWHSSGNTSAETWFKFDFGGVRALDKMYIWNMNQIADSDMTDRGIKNVKIEYSEDGTSWTSLAAPAGIQYGEESDPNYPFQFTRATGEAQMKATNLNTADHDPVSFNGIKARYIKITPKDSWGSQYWGLSELMFTELKPAAVKEVQATSVQTIAGIAPTLPKSVAVTLTDNTTRNVSVEWDKIDPKDYASANTFKVKGSLEGSAIKAECTITVKKPIMAENKVTNLTVASQSENETVITWNDPINVEFNKIIVKYQSADVVKEVEVEPGVGTLAITDTQPNKDYRVEVIVRDAYGYRSDAAVTYFQTSGEVEAEVVATNDPEAWPGVPFQNVINKSGISGTNVNNYLHDNNSGAKTMWHTQGNNTDLHIDLDFGAVKSLDKLYVWNMNQIGDGGADNTTRGLKNVKIEYSIDNVTWTPLAASTGIVYKDPADVDPDYPFQLAKASGSNAESASNLNTDGKEPIEFGVDARYVRITPKNSWGQVYWGLSELVFTEQSGNKLIASVDALSVKTVQNRSVKLPSFANVRYDDDSQELRAVVWDGFDESLLAKPGEFTVTGKILGTEQVVTCTVKVNAPNVKVDKEELAELIDVVIGKVQNAYTAESWAVLQAAFERANTVYDQADASQEAVNQAVVDLNNAISQLDLALTPDTISELLNHALKLLGQAEVYHGEEGYEGQVSQAAYNHFQSVVMPLKDEYESIMNGADLNTLDEYERGRLASIMASLDQAIDEFNHAKVHIDFNELIQAVEEAKKLNQNDYSESSWLKLIFALQNSERILNQSDRVTQSEVNAALSNLKAAQNSLAARPTREILSELVAKAEAINRKLYTEASLTVMDEALTYAKTVIANENSTQREIEIAYESLQAALNGLAKKPVEPSKPTDNDKPSNGNQGTNNTVNQEYLAGADTGIANVNGVEADAVRMFALITLSGVCIAVLNKKQRNKQVS